jgi:uncharacterized protein
MHIKIPKLPGRHWFTLAFTVILFVLVVVFVDLKPHVDENFFFSSHDPKLQESAAIDRMFPSVASSDIESEHYLDRLAQLTRDLQSVETVTSVESLADGPKNFEDAEKSPFWKRLLIADNGHSSNIVIFASDRDTELLINRVEAITSKFDGKDFRIHIAGAPYVAEMIRRNLRHDFNTFGLTSLLLFGAAMWALFRSLKLTLGMLATCTSAVLVTLLVQSMFGEKIGILTANLGTIVFVVALSHLVYMTFNWQTLASPESGRFARFRRESEAYDVSRVVLVNGVCFAWLRKFVDRARQAVARTRRWRHVGNGRGAALCLPYVSRIPRLGDSEENQDGG